MDFDKLFQGFQHCRMVVIGDVMLDSYCWGHVERISPEAPVPVVLLDNREERIGGAGNVALNLVSMGAPTSVFSVVGKDEAGDTLVSLMSSQGIDASHIIRSRGRKTTNKTRIISRSQQMMRLDAETTADVSPDEEALLIEGVKKFIEAENPSAVIFEDYNKGILTEKVISEVVDTCRKKGIITAVDPKRKNFFSYKGVTIFKPNFKEIKEGLNLLAETADLPTLKSMHEDLADRLQHSISFVTLSEHGVFYQQQQQAAIIPSHFRQIADVSGAGDTVIAVAALLYASTHDVVLMAEVANIAGGLVCEEVGTAAINKEKLLSECIALIRE